MARKPKILEPRTIVSYSVGNRTYQIDPDQKKVYRRFVEIETSKACEILASWRAAAAGA
ncbi:MAG: hypothetical protein GY716_20835 [bacterium]|nr:hypothetical protein [bacterium]